MHWSPVFNAVLIIAAALGVMLWNRRYGGSTAMSVLQQANEVLEKRCSELTAENTRLTSETLILHHRTDITTALRPVMQKLEQLEARNAEQGAQTIELLERVVEAIERNGNGVTLGGEG